MNVIDQLINVNVIDQLINVNAIDQLINVKHLEWKHKSEQSASLLSASHPDKLPDFND